MPEGMSRESERRAATEEAVEAAFEIDELKDELWSAQHTAKFTALVIEGLTEESRAAGEAADLAAAVAAKEIDHLKIGLENRLVLGQALGILMERFGIDAERACVYLARVSSHANVKLREVAGELVRTRHLPTIREALDEGQTPQTDNPRQ